MFRSSSAVQTVRNTAVLSQSLQMGTWFFGHNFENRSSKLIIHLLSLTEMFKKAKLVLSVISE